MGNSARASRLRRWLYAAIYLPRVRLALARGAAGAACRQLDPRTPASWEFKGFSQNGEDGLIDTLTRRLLCEQRSFLEIGCGDGLENNTSWLALTRQYRGLLVDADAAAVSKADVLMQLLGAPVDLLALRVDRDSCAGLLERAPGLRPDVFSLDIDGNDYWVAERLWELGLRPRIAVVEYNASFGPERELTIPYQADFSRDAAGCGGLYHGASLALWRRFFGERGYHFVAVDGNGVNAMFAERESFAPEFLAQLEEPGFRDNADQLRGHRQPWQQRLERLLELPCVTP